MPTEVCYFNKAQLSHNHNSNQTQLRKATNIPLQWVRGGRALVLCFYVSSVIFYTKSLHSHTNPIMPSLLPLYLRFSWASWIHSNPIILVSIAPTSKSAVPSRKALGLFFHILSVIFIRNHPILIQILSCLHYSLSYSHSAELLGFIVILSFLVSIVPTSWGAVPSHEAPGLWFHIPSVILKQNHPILT